MAAATHHTVYVIDQPGYRMGYIEGTYDLTDSDQFTNAGDGDGDGDGDVDTTSVTGFPANAYPLVGGILPYEYADDGDGDGTLSAATVELGDTNDPNGIGTATNVFATTSQTAWTQMAAGVEAKSGSTGPVLESAYAPIWTVRLTGGPMEELSAGAYHGRIYFEQFILDGA